MVNDFELYKRLGVRSTASLKEIKETFRTLSKLYHPDKTGSESDQYIGIVQAYGVLKDEVRRNAYDIYGMDALNRADGNIYDDQDQDDDEDDDDDQDNQTSINIPKLIIFASLTTILIIIGILLVSFVRKDFAQKSPTFCKPDFCANKNIVLPVAASPEKLSFNESNSCQYFESSRIRAAKKLRILKAEIETVNSNLGVLPPNLIKVKEMHSDSVEKYIKNMEISASEYEFQKLLFELNTSFQLFTETLVINPKAKDHILFKKCKNRLIKAYKI